MGPEKKGTPVQGAGSPEAQFLNMILGDMQSLPNSELGTFVAGAIAKTVESYSRQAKDEIDCRLGCNHCCRLMVAVSSAEAIAIYRHILDLWPAGRIMKLERRVIERAQKIAGMNAKEYWEATHAEGCIFLAKSDGGCSIYSARPRACSSLLVVDSDACKQEGGTIQQHEIPRTVGYIGYIALSKEIRRRGLQGGIYELNTALAWLFLNPGAYASWCNGGKVFRDEDNLNPGIDDKIHLEVFS